MWGFPLREADSIKMTRSQSRKHRGYKTQRVVAAYLSQWFPYAQSVGAGAQGSDILHTPFDIEVKARDRIDLPGTLKQLQARKGNRLGFAVLRLNGQGESAEEYCVVMRMGDFMELVIRCNKCGSWQELYGLCSTCQKEAKK